MPATLSLLTAAFPKSERNKAVGIWAGVAGSGAFIGFLGTGMLLHYFPWQSVFYAFGASAVLLFGLTCTTGSSRDESAAPVDWVGGALIGTAIATFVLGVIEAPARGWTDPIVAVCVTGGLALAVIFALVQLHRAHPLLDARLFAQPDFATGAVAITFLFFANFGIFFVMQFMQLVLGYSALQTALALTPLVVPVLIFSVTMHLYLPRVGLRAVATVGLSLLAIGLYCMRTLEADSSYLDLAWPLLIMASGIGVCSAPTTSAIMGAAPDEKQGVASAVNDATHEIGAALGIAVAGSVLAAGYHHSVAPNLGAFPQQTREGATESLAYALSVAERLGPNGAPLAELAETVFLYGMDQTLLVLSLVVAVATVIVAVWSPGRDARQSRVVARLREHRSTRGLTSRR